MLNSIFRLFNRTVSTTLKSESHIHNRKYFSLIMAEKYVEHESKRCSKRKRGFSHYQKKNSSAKMPKIGHEDIDITDYYFENGLRKVYPYFYSFTTYVKGRWIGRTIADVFAKEFKGVKNLEEEIRNGMLTVNGKPVTMDFKLHNGQFLEHKMHRHENPVVAAPPEIVSDTDDLLVINKPSSLPVHPCGRYRFNSLTVLLEKEYGYKNLRTLYRLDRLTSGVLLMPKTTAKSVVMEKQLASRQLTKEYVCRVEGEFPEGTIECKEPIGVISVPYAVSAVRPDGKECHTTFTRVSYNGRTSVVKCIPHTGRTHQIRVHLQFLGYPILNDPIYNSTAFGPEKGKGGKIDKPIHELEKLLSRHHNTSEWILGENPEYKRMFGDWDSVNACETNVPDSTDSPVISKVNDANDDDRTEVVKTEGDSFTPTSCKSSSEEKLSLESETTSNRKLECHPKMDVSSAEPVNICVTQINSDTSSDGCTTTVANDHSVITDFTDCSENDAAKQCPQPPEASEGHASPGCQVPSEDSGSSAMGRKPAAFACWEDYMASKQFDSSRYHLERVCHVCRNLYREPASKELILFLHAVRYKGPDWEYSTPLPDWAQDSWDQESQFILDWQT